MLIKGEIPKCEIRITRLLNLVLTANTGGAVADQEPEQHQRVAGSLQVSIRSQRVGCHRGDVQFGSDPREEAGRVPFGQRLLERWRQQAFQVPDAGEGLKVDSVFGSSLSRALGGQLRRTTGGGWR